MPKLKTLRIVQPAPMLAALLGELKQYASVPDTSRDAMLAEIVKAAALRVQEYADVAFIAVQLQLTATPSGGRVKLYEGGGEISSVTSARTGASLDYERAGDVLTVYGTDSGPVVVTYTTDPSEGEQVRLKPVVLRYATAVYDGAETDELNAILNEAL